MNHRSAHLTLRQLEVMRFMLRMQWTNAAQANSLKLVSTTQGVTVVDLVAEFINITDQFAPLQAALEVWTFQLRSHGLPGMQVIMSDELHRHFTTMAEADYTNYLAGNLSVETRTSMVKMLEDQPYVLKSLQEAATIDPEAITKGAKTLPGGKWSPMLN